jgi:integrase
MAVSKYDRDDRPNRPYGVKWTLSGKRKFKFFTTKKARDAFFTDLQTQERKHGLSILNMSADEAAIMRRCVDLLGNSSAVLHACEEYAKKINLVEIKPESAYQEYLKEIQTLSSSADHYRQKRVTLSRLIHSMPGKFAEWTAESAREWIFSLNKQFASLTVKNHAKYALAFCNWCIKRRYLNENVFKDAPIPDIIMPEPEFLKVLEMEKLFKTAVEKYPESVAYFALGAFAGLRSSATARLEINAIDFEQKGILIRADQSKNKRRIYIDGHEPNLWAWLEWAKKNAPHGFEITKRQWDAIRGKVAIAAKVKMPHNALRHSFCSYHVALYGDAGKTATLLTHRGNVAILYEHYKGNAARTEAEKYFNILPG